MDLQPNKCFQVQGKRRNDKMRNSASKKHKLIQSVLVTVAENIVCPAGWGVQAWAEYNIGEYLVDVMIKFYHPSKGNHKVYCEVQKNRTEKSFVKKIERYKFYRKTKRIETYLVIWEDEVPDDSGEMWDYLENMIEMNCLPW